jgi:outer membrane protein TolC
MMVRWKRWTHLAVALGGLAAAGAPPAWAQTTQARTTQPSQATATAPRQLSLDEALAAAEGASETVAIARAGVERARGQWYKARSQFLPQIYGTASYTRTLKSQYQGLSFGGDSTLGPPQCGAFVPDTTAPLSDRIRLLERALGCSSGNGLFGSGSLSELGFGAANQYNFGLSLSQNLFTGGRLRAQYRQARAGQRSAEIGFTSARAQLTLDVTQAYYDVVLSDRLLNIAEATLAQTETTLAQTRLARQVGNQPEFELLRAQVARDNQVPVVIQRRSDRDIAYFRLRQLLNLPLEQPLVLTTGLGDTVSTPSARLASLMQSAPDTGAGARAPVRQASENVRAQQNALTVARSQRVPSLTLSSSFGRVAYPSGFPDWNQFRSNWTVTGSIQVPLFTGGNIRGDEMVAQANLREAKARLQQTHELAALDTRNAIAQLQAAQAQWSASSGTVEQAARAYQIAEVRFREGLSTQTELSDSRILLQQAHWNRAVAARDLQVAQVRLALIRDLPLATTGGQPAATLTVPSQQQQQPQQQIPTPQQQPPQQAASAVRTSQSGVTP